MLTGIMQHIDEECNSNLDNFSQDVIIAQIGLLLTYTDRFYHRQFITRKISNHQVLDRLEQALSEYFKSDDLSKRGLPTGAYIVGMLIFRLIT